MSQVLHQALSHATERKYAERVAALTEELEALRRSLPAHSLKPAMLMRIEELEEEIERLKQEGTQRQASNAMQA